MSNISTNKKVILVSPLPPPVGGIASWTESYIKYAKNNNIKCHLINSAVVGERVQTGKISYKDEIKRTKKLHDELKWWSKNEKETVIHYNASCFTKGLIRDFLVLTGIKAPIVYQCHCNLDTNINNRLAKLMFRMVCKLVDVVCVLNTASVKVAKRYHNNVIYVPNFIDKPTFENKYINEHIENVCFVGRVEKRKGIQELINAAKAFPEILFNIIGPIEDEDLKKIGIPNVKFWGSVDNKEIFNILSEMDVYILPSYSEGFPLGVLEAMSCGVPVIATDVGAVKDMIGEGGGFIIKSKSVDDIINALTKMDSQEIRKKMSKININKVKDSYTIDAVMKQFLNIYSVIMRHERSFLKETNK